ncbi:MAG: GNAT family N-acetyltransferase [Pseudomonadales bacterium]
MTEISMLRKGDLQKLAELIRVYKEVFEIENFVLPSDEYLQSLLDRTGMMFLVATIESKVVGGLTAHDLPSTYFEGNELYVYDLAVANEYQRKGIGKTLMLELAEICKKKGDSEFFLQADFDDEHALEFYRSTGGFEESVFHFSYDTKS